MDPKWLKSSLTGTPNVPPNPFSYLHTCYASTLSDPNVQLMFWTATLQTATKVGRVQCSSYLTTLWWPNFTKTFRGHRTVGGQWCCLDLDVIFATISISYIVILGNVHTLNENWLRLCCILKKIECIFSNGSKSFKKKKKRRRRRKICGTFLNHFLYHN